jgi:restriction system protein
VTVPDYQSLMLPFLNSVRDDQPHRLRELYDTLGAEFRLSEEERSELLPSGRQSVFENRVGWARTYLKKAGLLASPGRGICVITARGQALLAEQPDEITVGLLNRFPEFVEFRRLRSKAEKENDQKEDVAETPGELLEEAYQRLKLELAQELLEAVKASPPQFFENLVVELLVRMGYGGSRQDAGKALGRVGDGGIDGVIKEDKLGLDVIYLQAKRWEGTVGRPVVQAFTGSLEGQRANKGVLITTSQFILSRRRRLRDSNRKEGRSD